MPTGTAQLVIGLDDGGFGAAPLLVGPRFSASSVATAMMRSVVGVSFRPGAISAFFDVRADECTGRDVPLEAFWPNDGPHLGDELSAATSPDAAIDALSRALRRRLRQRLLPHQAVRTALAEFHRAPNDSDVLDVARQTGLSRRRFAQLFREAVGLTPKLYCRVQRFTRAIQIVNRRAHVTWTDLALTCGYYDQSHFNRDFREFANMSPSAYLAHRRPWLNHVAFD